MYCDPLHQPHGRSTLQRYAVSSRKWYGVNEWMDRPKVNVALGVQGEEVSKLCVALMSA